MRRYITAGVLLLGVLLANLFVSVAPLAAAVDQAPVDQAAVESVQLPLKTTLAPDWTKMWDRRSGWVASDGIYSIPLDGNDSLGSATASSKTLWLYSDTVLGSINDSSLAMGTTMVNHSLSTFTGNTPQPANMNFIYGSHGDMTASNIFGTRYWLLDGVTVGSNVYVFGYLVGSSWNPTRVDMIKIPIVNGNPDLANYTIFPNTPLVNTIDGYTVMFGAGIMDNRASAGAPNPDGYIYSYGFRNSDDFNSQLIASRVLPQDIENFANWQFWNGSSWTNDARQANSASALLGPMHISNEFSVTPITTGIYAGKYMAVYTRGIGSTTMEYSLADSPIGPFGEGVAFFDAPEPEIYSGQIFTYNAKAHPHLSPPGHLLVTYNVNGNGATNEVYRSRWLDIDLSSFASKPVLANVSSQTDATASGYYNAQCAPKYGASSTPYRKWCDTTPGDKWLKLDLGKTYYLSKYVLKNAQWGKESAVSNTRDWKVQVSADGSNWTDVDQVAGNTAGVVRRSFAQTAARYVRLYITKATQDAGDGAARVFSLDVYGRTSPVAADNRVNVALGKPVTASGQYSPASAPSKLVDGRWSDANNDKWVDITPGDKWAKVDLGGTYRISRYVVRHAGVVEATRLNTNYFRLQASSDGSTWTDVDTVDYNMYSTNDREIVPFDARYVRLYVTKPALSNDTAARIYELEVYSDPDPVQHNWTLDESSGTTAADATGSGINATVNGATWSAGHLGNALAFDGVNDYAFVSSYPKPSSGATYSAWVKANSAATWGEILSNWGQATTGQFNLGLVGTTGRLGFGITQSNGATVSGNDSATFPLGQWVHVALVMDGSVVRLYKGGAQVASAGYNGTLKTTFNPLGIGAKPNDAGTGPASSNAGYWNGSIDDVRVYNKALSGAEIAALAAQ